ncbi:nuclease-related domain-containing protein [Bacillus thuringiensis]|uniref:NERD domain-containing protein n=1 Tax=Bacillus thuringiensis serovar andalousiensis TaxID=257985 RepID=A0A6H0TGJ2_BACTU|nr:nuclease-related domain-containing protein [Bacillus thuringiensis]QIW20311.1 NERD domain-containing protein [Bacillus thuringiensis serovar andalousiensis]
MIVKERQMPIYLRQLEALFRRLPAHHRKRDMIVESLAKHKAGYKGEQAINYQLSFLSEEKYRILHDIRLFDQNYHFQIDTIIISAYFLLFLEIKNIVGTLLFDSKFNQLIRISEGNSEGFPDPILQVKRQEEQLRRWLSLNGFSRFPIESLVVISTPRTIIKASDDNLLNKIIHSANLPNKIKWFESKYKKKAIKNVDNLICQIVAKHAPLRQNILEQFKINKEELLDGVQCEVCSILPMFKLKKGWYCSNCKAISKVAHEFALKDYALLIGDTCTNMQLKKFLNVQSSATVKRLLQTMNIPHTGDNKGRIYDLTSFQS